MVLFLKILKWTVIVIGGSFVVLVIGRAIHFYNLDKTNAQVEKIHNTKLTLDDVMGKNLPPDPGALADQTVAGIDANENGIRDDVELAIFKKYSNSAKTRAVLLQYALALQMEFTQLIINKETVVATVQEEDRAYICLDKDELINFVKEKQLNTEARKSYRKSYYEKAGSYESLDHKCDIDTSSL